MKKVKTSADLHQKQGLEQSKKLYRTTSEQAKRLDDARSCARTISDLFTPNLHIQRRKFCEYCERLIFSDPLLYGKKGEELLWRKGYYDVISSAKRLKKKEYSQNDIISIQNHINSGVGFYHHLITKLQTEFGLKLKNVIDFTIENSTKTAENVKPEHLEWAMQAAHQCLIYLGDLNRYKLEIHSDEQPTLSFRYYLQAISYKSDHGMPHNQMGTLAMNQDRYLDAVYHYMRCLSCSVSFEGTTNNLHSLFEKNSMFIEQLPQSSSEEVVDNNQNLPEKTDHLKHFIARFLLLIDIWYFNKKVSKMYNLCHQTCKDLEECLISPKVSSECASPVELESTETSSSSSTSSTTPQLTNDMIFKIVVICLLCVTKLQKLNSQQVSTVVAFTLAIYSQLVQNVTSHIQDQVLNYPLPPEASEIISSNGIVKALLDRGKKKQKLRRRKAIEMDSEASEDEQDDSLSDSSDDSFISECDALAHSSEDDEEEQIKPSNDKDIVKDLEEEFNEDEIVKRVKRMDVDDMLEIIMEEGSLHSIKIINDWLMLDTDILKSCGLSTRSLLKQITDMLNLINIDIKHKLNGVDLDVDNIIKNERKIPIAEDVVLKGVEILAKSHKSIDWNYMKKRGVNAKEETVIRIVKLMTFGKFLTSIDETGISFDESKNEFVCKVEEPEKPKTPPSVTIIEDFESQNSENGPPSTKAINNKDPENKGQLLKMKHMGQLWLASEVRALENRVRGGKTSLSPYLVLDADALIKYTFMIKHLVHSRKFIVLVPSAVVSALDDLKREQSEARDAIRWLESQFHRGNRFFRSQRPHEKAPIPFIKYPKKKDKEMTTYIQIIECCHYLAEQQKDASNLVTLLIGNQNVLSNGENKEFSYVGLAKSAGVSIESITQFYGKWKKNYKGKR